MTVLRNDYFANHQRARRFPWSLYHRPLEENLVAFLERVASRKPSAQILVVGCGLMHELDRLPPGLTAVVLDIDPRATEAVLARHHPAVTRALVIKPEEDLSVLHEKWDAIYAKEVIEHVVPWQRYLQGLRQSLAPGGEVWLSTPNYGEPWLPVVEATVLEPLARGTGFSRRGIHPSRFSRRTLAEGLRTAGFHDVRVQPISWRFALVATARV